MATQVTDTNITLTQEQERLVLLAERQIETALNSLERNIGLSINQVNVDTRNFAQLKTEIFLRRRPRF